MKQSKKNQAKRELILNATEKLMCRMSGNEITISLIAKEAGIGKGSVYYYFDCKEQLFDEIITRSYKNAIHEFFSDLQTETSALAKIRLLFQTIVKPEFQDKQTNLIRKFNLQDNIQLHNKMKYIAVQEISPVLTALLQQGCAEGTIQTDTPKESAEMIVAVLTFFFDTTIFPDENDKESMQKKMKIFARVLDTCLHAAPGSFDFLWLVEFEDME